ncbi:MAG TPA: DcaP family trimeric outer membrane transporter, partial [Chitinophagaceae bacterium]|nr:DcaP family trimeric outer membrane transporter [Chitinophagaceae bacterium]
LGSIAQEEPKKEKSLEIYGFVMMDAGYNFNQIHPDWFDVVRPTKLPAYKNQYGTDGNTYFGVRQTRLGVKGYHNTPLGELKTTFEFEMFGTGVDAGQTTFRLRHAYGELGKFGAGQYWSPFMDIDVFPNTVEYWGPSGMAFFRNVQFRYMPIQGDTRLTFALERPGASADQGNYSDRIELSNVKPRFKLPDLSAEYRLGRKWGYVELAGILRKIEWEDQNNNPNYDISGDALGWGLNFSTNLKLGKSTIFRGQYLFGEGVQNYMNDAPADIGIKNNFSNPRKPIEGVPLPVQGLVAFIDHNWSNQFSTSIGYSSISIDNSDGSADNAFKHGDYAVVNLLYTPVERVMMGVELQYGKRTNFRDDFTSDILKMQFSFKYNFSHMFYKDAK